MKISTSSILALIVLGVWGLLGAHLVADLLEHDAFLVTLAASILAPILFMTERLIREIRDLGIRAERKTISTVIEAMAKGEVKAKLDKADSNGASWGDAGRWSDTGPFPAIRGVSRN